MARAWLSIRVELVSGQGADLRPRPGRIFAATRSRFFAEFATAIDLAFGRWDEGEGESSMPKRPTRGLGGLPPILPGWGEPRQG
ncbi:hypothetical protein OG885_43620 [Streptomyces sp. NBC_00028]|uniref:hypothetical protein n=1 Tax=Streptomyces sp. NBC_00028 TaxID=2975624 RepID=UPI00324320C6